MKLHLKEKVLWALESSSGQSISGQELADKLGTSRAAIWKSIESLRKEGCPIIASPNVGYSLPNDYNFLSKEGILVALSNISSLSSDEGNQNNPSQNSILVYQTIDSTNREAARRISDEALPSSPIFPDTFQHSGLKFVVIANEQTRGQGRLNRDFFSPKDTGLYITLVIKPRFKIESVTLLTTMVSVALVDIFKEIIDVDCKIKWVNDIYLNNLKICGIRTEGITNFETGQIEHVILGIGINCFTKEFTKMAGPNAGSLSKNIFSRNLLAAHIIHSCNQLLISMETFSLQNPTKKQLSLLQDYKDKSFLIGKEIVILNTNTIATAQDIGIDGSLIVKTSEGNIERIFSGEVSVRLK